MPRPKTRLGKRLVEAVTEGERIINDVQKLIDDLRKIAEEIKEKKKD